MGMGVYNAVGALMDPKVPAYLMSTVKESDARAAYNALVDFTQVVKANPVTPSTPASSVSGSAASSITAAADKLSAAAYPFIKDIDWTSDLYSKPIPGADPQKVTKAIGKMITMGAAMDGASLKEAANAHVKAIGGHGREGRAVAVRFRVHQRGPREGDRIGADKQGDGRLQLDGPGGRELGCSQQAVLHSEPG